MIGDAILPVSAERFARLYHPGSTHRVLIDKPIDAVHILAKVDKVALSVIIVILKRNSFQHTALVAHISKPQFMGLVGARDSVDLVRMFQEDGSYFLMSTFAPHFTCKFDRFVVTSVESPDYPPQKTHVRIANHMCGLRIDPIG